MARTRRSRSVADAGCPYGARNAFEPVGQQGTVYNRNHRAQMADHRHQPFPRPPPMHISVPGPHRAKGGAQISSDGIQQRLAERQPPRQITDERGKNVPFPQGYAYRGTQRLLAATNEYAAMNFAHPIKTGKFLIQKSRQQSNSVRFDVFIMHRGSLARRAGLKHSVNHGANLACPRGAPQRFFAALQPVAAPHEDGHPPPIDALHSTIPCAVVSCPMAKKRAPGPTNPRKSNASETLDALNVRLRRRSGAIRRSMEADLEEKARNRRTGEAQASAAWEPLKIVPFIFRGVTLLRFPYNSGSNVRNRRQLQTVVIPLPYRG